MTPDPGLLTSYILNLGKASEKLGSHAQRLETVRTRTAIASTRRWILYPLTASPGKHASDACPTRQLNFPSLALACGSDVRRPIPSVPSLLAASFINLCLCRGIVRGAPRARRMLVSFVVLDEETWLQIPRKNLIAYGCRCPFGRKEGFPGDPWLMEIPIDMGVWRWNAADDHLGARPTNARAEELVGFAQVRDLIIRTSPLLLIHCFSRSTR